MITDNAGEVVYVVPTEPMGIIADVLETNVSNCSGICVGAATTTVIGGTSPFSYLWTDYITSTPLAQTTPNLTGLCKGIYLLEVTDANGCATPFGYSGAIINEPSIDLDIINITRTTCTGNCDGEATALATGGVGSMYSYLWSNGASTQTATGLCVGSHGVTVTDANGCGPVSTNVTIRSIATAPSATAFSCNPPTISQPVVIGPEPMECATYSWSPTSNVLGPSDIAQPTVFLTGSPIALSQTYTVTVTLGSCIEVHNVVVNPTFCRLQSDEESNYGRTIGGKKELLISYKTEEFKGTLYPNPSDGSVTYEYFLASSYNAIFNVVSMYGQIVAQHTLSPGSNKLILNLNHLNSGIYMYEVHSQQIVVDANKLIISK